MRTFIIILFFVIACCGNAGAQKNKTGTGIFALGVTDTLHSEELAETRALNIYLPEGYDTASAAYPVIYLLDGSANEDFIHVTGIVQFLTMIGSMPKTIVIGIANVDRRRDFTFPTAIVKDKQAYPTTGSSAKFIVFMEKELQPFVEKKYRCNGIKTIIGQSLGGLLGTEILLKKPRLFNNYIIVSPSLWWNNESLLAEAPGLLQNQPCQNITAYVATGKEGKIMEGDAKKLVSLLKQKAAASVNTVYSYFPHEDHLTILHNCVYNALMALNKK